MKRWLTLVFALLIMTMVLVYPNQTKAVSLLTPFGGKVEEYDPAPTTCVSEITLPVATATFFTTWITIEKIKVGKPKGGTFGILRVNFIPVMPPLTNIKKYYAYMVPGTWVLGNSINLCSVCEKVESAGEKVGAGFAKDFCKSIPGIGEILDAICSIASGCPVDNLIYQIGTGSPIGGVAQNIARTVCKSILDKIPLIGSFLGGVCDSL